MGTGFYVPVYVLLCVQFWEYEAAVWEVQQGRQQHT